MVAGGVPGTESMPARVVRERDSPLAPLVDRRTSLRHLLASCARSIDPVCVDVEALSAAPGPDAEFEGVLGRERGDYGPERSAFAALAALVLAVVLVVIVVVVFRRRRERRGRGGRSGRRDGRKSVLTRAAPGSPARAALIA